MPAKIFKHFLGRLIAAFLVVTALVTLSVFWYFQHQAGETLQALVKEETKRFNQATIGLDWELESDRPRIIEVLRELLERRELAELLITVADGTEIFRYSRTGREPMLVSESGLNDPSEVGELKYRLTRRDSNYSLIFSIYENTAQGNSFVRGILPMQEDFVDRLEGTALIALTVVLVTATSIGITILPLVRRAYNEIERRLHQLQHSYLATTLTLGRAIAKRDDETGRHNFRVAYYALRLGESIGLDKVTIRSLTLGAFLHDLGKIGIPDNILRKPGKLNKSECEIMHDHVSLGLEIIAGIDWLQQAMGVIGSHHEHFDGDGYPLHLYGEKIPIEARVFAVVDVFDALTSERPYKPAYTVVQALKKLSESAGTHLDPKIVKAFLAMAPTLYHEVAGLDDLQIQAILQQAAEPYFPELRA